MSVSVIVFSLSSFWRLFWHRCSIVLEQRYHYTREK